MGDDRERRRDKDAPSGRKESPPPERIAEQDGYVAAEDEGTIAKRTEQEDAASG